METHLQNKFWCSEHTWQIGCFHRWCFIYCWLLGFQYHRHRFMFLSVGDDTRRVFLSVQLCAWWFHHTKVICVSQSQTANTLRLAWNFLTQTTACCCCWLLLEGKAAHNWWSRISFLHNNSILVWQMIQCVRFLLKTCAAMRMSCVFLWVFCHFHEQYHHHPFELLDGNVSNSHLFFVFSFLRTLKRFTSCLDGNPANINF